MMISHHAKNIKVCGQFVQQTERKQTDRRTDTTDRITFPADAVGRVGFSWWDALAQLNKSWA